MHSATTTSSASCAASPHELTTAAIERARRADEHLGALAAEGLLLELGLQLEEAQPWPTLSAS